MSKSDVQKDLDTIKAGTLALIASMKPPVMPKPTGKDKPDRNAIEKALNEHEKNGAAVLDEQMPLMIEAGFRIIGGLFVNMQRIADAIEDQHGAS